MSELKRIASLCIIGVLVLSCVGMTVGCSGRSDDFITDISRLNDSEYTITLDAGSTAALDAKKAFPNATFSYSPTAADAYLAVSKGTADAFVYGKLYMQYAIASESFDNLTVLDGVLNTADIAAGINPKRADLVDGVNAFIKQIKSDGTFEDMYERWVIKADDRMPEIPKAENPDKTVRFGTSGMVVPMNYYGDDNELLGFDIEFMRRLALYLNADYTIDVMGFDPLVTSLQADRLDIVVTDLNVTEERKEVISFSDPYIVSETAVVVRKAPSNRNGITGVDGLNGKIIGCVEDSSYIPAIKSKFPDSAIVEYGTNADLIAAIKSGRIEAYITDEPMAYSQLKEADGIAVIDEMLTEDKYGFVLNKSNPELCGDISGVINELREQGVLDELKEKWITAEETPVFDNAQPWEKPNGTLTVSLAPDSVPFAYVQNEETVGYDVELMYMIAEKLGYGVEIVICDFSAVISSISSGRGDVAIGCITYTPERAESVLFTDFTYDSGAVAVVLDGNESSKGFFGKLGDSFERTFIKESRWKLVANGLAVTLELSVLTLVIGTLAGFGFSFLLRSKNKLVSGGAGVFCNILDGLPLLIILMVMYYIIFAKTTVSAVTIGVIGLSLDFANAVAGILNTGVAGVDKGQIEAAEAMGYSRWKTFMRITLPQAVNQMFSQYTGAVIGMVKGTSIIGYITVTDLTKAGDIIRSLTYEAFFPLISIAAIYFILAQIMILILKAVARKINPKHRKRQIRGVKISD